MKVRSYKELDVWTKGMEVVNHIYAITEEFPSKELYGLAAQMQRSAVSIPSNIAEGFARGHTAEYVQFLRIALGSRAELETQLIIADTRNYVAKPDVLSLQGALGHESRMIMNLIKSLKGNKRR